MHARVQPVVDEVRRHRARFDDFCRTLKEEQLNRPVPESTWIVRDYISHLATIDKTVVVWFESLADGGAAPAAAQTRDAADAGGAAFDIDAWNDGQVTKLRDTPVPELLNLARDHRTHLLAAMDRFTDATLDADIAFPGDANRPPESINFGGYLTAWAKHDPAHARDMLRALPERARDPALRIWLESATIGAWPPAGRL
jgi:hypothetical protein